MTWPVAKALFWKEWRESRFKFLALLAAFHLPMVAFIRFADFLKRPDHDLMVFQIMAPHLLYGTLFYQSGFNLTVGAFLISFFAAGAMAGEFDGNRMFFVLERPVSRTTFLGVKSAVYGLEALIAMCGSLFTTQLLVYLVYNRDGDPRLAIPAGDLAEVTGAGFRGVVWLGTLGLLAFGCSFLAGIFFEKSWTAMIAGTLTIAVLLYFLYFRIYERMFFRFTHSGSLNIDNYGRLEALPLVLLLASAILAFLAAHAVFSRKEIG